MGNDYVVGNNDVGNNYTENYDMDNNYMNDGYMGLLTKRTCRS